AQGRRQRNEQDSCQPTVHCAPPPCGSSPLTKTSDLSDQNGRFVSDAFQPRCSRTANAKCRADSQWVGDHPEIANATSRGEVFGSASSRVMSVSTRHRASTD